MRLMQSFWDATLFQKGLPEAGQSQAGFWGRAPGVRPRLLSAQLTQGAERVGQTAQSIDQAGADSVLSL